MTELKYPIGFWNYPNINDTPAKDAESWARAGITCNQTPSFSYSCNKPEQMLAMLDAMDAKGIKAFVVIYDINFYNFLNDPEAFRPAFERAYKDFGHHPATVGFFIGDEPSGDAAMNACTRAMQIMHEVAPEMIPLLNFLPYWRGIENDLLGGRDFAEWIDDFIKKTGCPLICYDCYAQMNPGKEGWDMYFVNLNKYVAAAERNKIKLWNTLLSCGHFRYRVPSEDDFRWQVSTSVASGCNGLLWFLWYGQNARNNYRGAPIDELGEESETYKALRRVQLLFHRRYGNIISELEHKATYHYVETYGDYTEYTDHAIPHVRKVVSEHGLPGIVSRFTDKDGNEYVAIVNNTPFESGQHTIVMDAGVKHIWRYWDGNVASDFIQDPHDATLQFRDDHVNAGFWLAPGQMELFRLEY